MVVESLEDDRRYGFVKMKGAPEKFQRFLDLCSCSFSHFLILHASSHAPSPHFSRARSHASLIAVLFLILALARALVALNPMLTSFSGCSIKDSFRFMLPSFSFRAHAHLTATLMYV